MNIINQDEVWSYNTTSYSWSQSSLPGTVAGGAWLVTSDGRSVNISSQIVLKYFLKFYCVKADQSGRAEPGEKAA